jgi:hypothetical protein
MLDFDEPEWEEEREWEDAYVEDAKTALRAFFAERNQEVFYLKQLEVLFEKHFFHWVTARAVSRLVEDEVLGTELVPIEGETKARFVFNRRHRYYKRQIDKSLGIIRNYSRPDIAGGCGEQADTLFCHGLLKRGFGLVGEDVNEHGGRKWTETNHNLDFIIDRDDRTYGCEVKNTWDYIDVDEMRIKLNMCEFLGIIPLFVMRYSPKTYNDEVISRGGFVLIFVSQIYPLGQQSLVKRIKEELGLPADCPKAIPSGIIDRFMKWHVSKV